MGLYGLAAASGPAIAPVVSGYAVVYNGWRWAFWIMLWLSGFSLLLLAFTMPEVRSRGPGHPLVPTFDTHHRPPPRTSSTVGLSDSVE